MKINKLSLLYTISAILLLSTLISAQKKFSDPNVEYTFVLPNSSWKMTVKPDAISPNVEYVYKFRHQGLLQIRRLKVKAGSLISDAIRNEEQRLQFRPGFVAGKDKPFRGAFSGRVFPYEYAKSGRNMSGRAYFLKFSDTVIYVLRFTGRKANLRLIRNQTDSISRTFSKK